MDTISVMEMNTKPPFLWDWDNLVVYPAARAADVPHKLQLADSEFEPIEGFEISAFHSSAGDSASDLGYGSSSKSKESASVDSSSNKEIRDSKFKLEASDLDFSQKLSSGKPASMGSGDSVIGLKLGKRTYFEDVPESSSHVTGKRLKLSTQSTEIPRCQVEGCNLDLSSAKDYHRKHRVCESHAKNPKVVICGVERRFCQQCSRFHSLSEFDQKKRSCRRRLSDHNARRRKPKPETIQFNSMGLPSSLHEGRNQINLVFNQVPMVQARPNSNATWDFTSSSKLAHEKHGLFSPKKFEGIDTPCASPQNEPRETGFKSSYDSTHLMPSNGTAADVLRQGFQVSKAINNFNSGPELRALSLLSTNSWGYCSQEPTPPPLDHQSSLIQHNHHVRPHHMPAASAEYCPGEQQLRPSSFSLQFPSLQKNGTTNPCQEFQSLKPANEKDSIYFYECL